MKKKIVVCLLFIFIVSLLSLGVLNNEDIKRAYIDDLNYKENL